MCWASQWHNDVQDKVTDLQLQQSFEQITPKIGDNNITQFPSGRNPVAIFDFWWTFDYGRVCQQCLSLFFLPSAQHQQHSKSVGYEDSCHHFQALVISRLDYCNTLLCGLPSILIKMLQRVQNVAARLIAKTGRRDHISPILFKLHWLSIEFPYSRGSCYWHIVLYMTLHKLTSQSC